MVYKNKFGAYEKLVQQRKEMSSELKLQD